MTRDQNPICKPHNKGESMRSYIVELLGTFLLTLVIAFSGEPPVVGLLFIGLVYLGIHISGAHYNPAVTLAAFIRGKLSVQHCVMYVSMQILGAAVAMMAYGRVTATTWGSDLTPADLAISVSLEVLLTAILVITILTVGMSARYRGSMVHGLIIGFVLIALVGLNGLMNPAVAVGALLVGQLFATPVLSDINSVATYVGAPLLGSVCATYLYQFLNPDER